MKKKILLSIIIMFFSFFIVSNEVWAGTIELSCNYKSPQNTTTVTYEEYDNKSKFIIKTAYATGIFALRNVEIVCGSKEVDQEKFTLAATKGKSLSTIATLGLFLEDTNSLYYCNSYDVTKQKNTELCTNLLYYEKELKDDDAKSCKNETIEVTIFGQEKPTNGNWYRMEEFTCIHETKTSSPEASDSENVVCADYSGERENCNSLAECGYKLEDNACYGWAAFNDRSNCEANGFFYTGNTCLKSGDESNCVGGFILSDSKDSKGNTIKTCKEVVKEPENSDDETSDDGEKTTEDASGDESKAEDVPAVEVRPSDEGDSTSEEEADTPYTSSGSDVSCADWGKVRDDLRNLFNFMKFLIPLLIIGLSTYEFIKAVTAKDEKDLKNAFKSLFIRFVLAVVFFFLPVLIEVLLDLFEVNAEICIFKLF